ncbi:MAG: hypothetical protein MUE42_09810 [Opitutaceae bacterium]|jgi:hypothetical protein|nr:hypothetical protein [Opitutaceae bacterium]
MKSPLHAALAFILAAALGHAETLTTSLPAYASPDEAAPILGTARAGSRLATSAAPSGWQAVELAGPHTVFVTEKDTLKNFEVRPGAAYYAAPVPTAPVIGLAGDKDPAEFADVAGRFNKFSLNKPLIAYVRATPVAVTPVAVPEPVAPAVLAETPAPAYVAPAAPAAQAAPADDFANTLRNDIPANNPTVPGSGLGLGEPALARTFFGTVASTRNPLRPRRPFDFQLNDARGGRIAYLDVSRLLQTEQIDAFVGKPVALFGTAEAVGVAGKEIVIRVETLKLQ